MISLAVLGAPNKIVLTLSELTEQIRRMSRACELPLMVDADHGYLMGPAGSITIHNCRALHYSPSSKSPEPRPLLLNCYSSGDAKPYTPHPDPSSHTYEVVRGKPVKWAHHDPRPCQIPPNWSGGYASIFAVQAGEDG